jgi:hypothetical protein
METLTKKSKVINFLRTDQKKIDWRYITSDSMENKSIRGQTTIYWLGIIPLDNIDENQQKYPVRFVTYHGDVKEDSEYTRDPDGAQRGITVILYDLTELLPVLMTAKRMGSKYVHVLIEEQVQANGALTANILVSKGKSGINILSRTGFQSDEPWIELGSRYTHHLSYVDISDLRRICIRSTRSYNWQK